MFWRSFLAHTSRIDTLLQNPRVTLEQLLDEEELIQEVKTQNLKLLNFLTLDENIAKLLDLMLAIDPAIDSADAAGTDANANDDERREKVNRKYPHLAAEILCCEVEAVLAKTLPMLPRSFKILESSSDTPLAPHIADNFARVLAVFLTRAPQDVLAQVQADNGHVVDRLIAHIGASGFADLLVRLLQVSYSMQGDSQDQQEGADPSVAANEHMRWWTEFGVVRKLIDSFGLRAETDDDSHFCAAHVLSAVVQNFAAATDLINQFDVDRLLELAFARKGTDLYLHILTALSACSSQEQLQKIHAKSGEFFGVLNEENEKNVGRFRLKTIEFITLIIIRSPQAVMSWSQCIRAVLVKLFFQFEKASLLHNLATKLLHEVLISADDDIKEDILVRAGFVEQLMASYQPNSGQGNTGHMTIMLNEIAHSQWTPTLFERVPAFKVFVDTKLNEQNALQERTIGGPKPAFGNVGNTGLASSISGSASGGSLNSSVLSGKLSDTGNVMSYVHGLGVSQMDIDDDDQDDDEEEVRSYQMDDGELALRSPPVGNRNQNVFRTGNVPAVASVRPVSDKSRSDGFEYDSDSDSSDEGDGLANHTVPAPVQEQDWANFDEAQFQ
eukprot:ANDGO_00479.mRNA.1 Extragenic suppressor of kinetochore protein 1